MSADQITFLQKKLRQMGRWMFPRYCRNRGIAFEHAYFIMFGRPPRLP